MHKDQLLTPCFLFDEQEFVTNLKLFKKALDSRFRNNLIGYSFKTNSLPRFLELVRQSNCYAEVVSSDEYALAEKIGFQPDRIIYNGPIKTKDSFYYALHNHSIINIDSKQEVSYLTEDSSFCGSCIGVRVNFDLESILPGSTSTKESGGRFGFSYETGELKQVISTLQDHKIKIEGLHMHVSNASKSPSVYRVLAEKAAAIIKEFQLDVRYIDFGGGYFGGGDNGESYKNYVNEIADTLEAHHLQDITVIVEPGASVVATAFSYLTRVTDTKFTTHGKFVVTDGTRLHIDPFLRKSNYQYSISSNSRIQENEQIICGYSCMEADRFMTVSHEPDLSIDDTIEYKIVGSYTMTFHSLFINYLPRVYSNQECEYSLIRDKWSIDELIQKNRW